MLIVVYMLNVLTILLFRLYYDVLQNSQLSRTASAKENITLETLIPTSILKSWKEGMANEDLGKVPLSRNISEDSIENTVEDCLKSNGSCVDNSLKTIVDSANKSSELEPEFERYIETLFNPPSESVTPDWDVVLGTFSFYAEEKWSNFLIKTETPILIRMVIENISEVLSFSRKNKKVKERIHSTKEEKSSENIEMLYRATVWIISHDTKFRLNEKFTELDFVDGDTSENIFFFLAPRLLVQNKYKLNHRVAMIFHFDETNLNITFFDRDVVTVARRFYKRID